jgi:hypothetical protein
MVNLGPFGWDVGDYWAPVDRITLPARQRYKAPVISTCQGAHPLTS